MYVRGFRFYTGRYSHFGNNKSLQHLGWAAGTWMSPVRSMYYRKAGYYQGNASWLPLYGLHKSEHAACSLTNSGVTQRRAKIKMAQDSLSPPGQDDLQVLHMGSSLNQGPFLGRSLL